MAESAIRRLAIENRPRLLRLGVGRVPLPGPEWMRFDLADYWALHLYRYRGELRLGETVHEVYPGTISLAPPRTPLAYRWRPEPSEHLYVLFRAGGRGGRSIAVPALLRPGAVFERLYAALIEAVGYFAVEPLRAEVRLWDVLWELAELGESAGQRGGAHPALREAQRYIEQRLSGRICVPEVARHAGLSHNHLIRLFNAQFGASIAAYIRRRRVEHARHLLTRTTLPIKAVAAEIGIPDLQRFNKIIRRELGDSPRGVRGVRRVGEG